MEYDESVGEKSRLEKQLDEIIKDIYRRSPGYLRKQKGENPPFRYRINEKSFGRQLEIITVEEMTVKKSVGKEVHYLPTGMDIGRAKPALCAVIGYFESYLESGGDTPGWKESDGLYALRGVDKWQFYNRPNTNIPRHIKFSAEKASSEG